MTCNTPLMNSWHSFSPNGRWLVFSSKSRSPYTQMFLTHIDAEGHDTPAILIENSTAANRAVNIPEFVNMEPSGIEHIATPAVDFYKQYDVAADLAKKGQLAAALPEWAKAIRDEPGGRARAQQLRADAGAGGQEREAIAQLQKAVLIKPRIIQRRRIIWPLRWRARGVRRRPSSITARRSKTIPATPRRATIWAARCWRSTGCPRPSSSYRRRSRSILSTPRRTTIWASRWPARAISTRPWSTIARPSRAIPSTPTPTTIWAWRWPCRATWTKRLRISARRPNWTRLRRGGGQPGPCAALQG
jgi:hypothetical protein